MKKIFYSVGGEGRGHATRVQTVVEELRRDHQISIYAPGHAFSLLEPIYRRTEVQVTAIPGIPFQYSRNGQTNYLKSALYATGYMLRLPRLIKKLRREIESEEPDLIITDYEPALPRAAKLCGVPFVSLDHQHFLVTYDLSSLPRSLQKYARWMSHIVKRCYTGQKETIVSSFFFPPLRSQAKNVKQIGVLLRHDIFHASPYKGDHVVAYVRRFASPSVLAALRSYGGEVRVYGLGALPSTGPMRFQEIDPRRFAEDLATCRALVTTAGNQLVGEALYLAKPVLAIPEVKNHEQEINGYFLQESGDGICLPMDQLTPESFRVFLKRYENHSYRTDRSRLVGNTRAKALILSHLH